MYRGFHEKGTHSYNVILNTVQGQVVEGFTECTLTKESCPRGTTCLRYSIKNNIVLVPSGIDR